MATTIKRTDDDEIIVTVTTPLTKEQYEAIKGKELFRALFLKNLYEAYFQEFAK